MGSVLHLIAKLLFVMNDIYAFVECHFKNFRIINIFSILVAVLLTLEELNDLLFYTKLSS